MSEETGGVSAKQLTIILAVVGVMLGTPLTMISFWSISGFERLERKIELLDRRVELLDDKMNNLAVEFAQVEGALRAKGIVNHQGGRAQVHRRAEP